MSNLELRVASTGPLTGREDAWSVRLRPAQRAAGPGERCAGCGLARPFAWDEVHVRESVPDGWFRESRIVKHLCADCGRKFSATLVQR
jgi:hypothetical protein